MMHGGNGRGACRGSPDGIRARRGQAESEGSEAVLPSVLVAFLLRAVLLEGFLWESPFRLMGTAAGMGLGGQGKALVDAGDHECIPDKCILEEVDKQPAAVPAKLSTTHLVSIEDNSDGQYGVVSRSCDFLSGPVGTQATSCLCILLTLCAMAYIQPDVACWELISKSSSCSRLEVPPLSSD